MLNVAVTEVSLKRPRIVPLIGQRIPAGVPEHVWVCLEAELRFDACPLDHTREPCRRERDFEESARGIGRKDRT